LPSWETGKSLRLVSKRQSTVFVAGFCFFFAGFQLRVESTLPLLHFRIDGLFDLIDFEFACGVFELLIGEPSAAAKTATGGFECRQFLQFRRTVIRYRHRNTLTIKSVRMREPLRVTFSLHRCWRETSRERDLLQEQSLLPTFPGNVVNRWGRTAAAIAAANTAGTPPPPPPHVAQTGESKSNIKARLSCAKEWSS
jgi:hypothetical protein